MKLAANLNHFKLDSFSKIIIAYSGGLDSTALLHLLASDPILSPKLLAIHINHNISDESDTWQKHCQTFCQQLQVKFESEKLKEKLYSEESLRDARYKVLASYLGDNEVIVTAHHKNDQAETLLFRMIRGTGLIGLNGINDQRDFAKGKMIRPLLNVSKNDLKEYCQFHDLSWVEDPSNKDSQYSRNFIRNDLIPKIKSHWPTAEKNLALTANNLQNSSELLNYLVNDSKTNLWIEVSYIQKLPVNLQITYLYHWISAKGLSVPSSASLNSIIETFLNSKPGAKAKFVAKDFEVRLWKDRVYCIKKFNPPDPEKIYSWNGLDLFVSEQQLIKISGNLDCDLIIKFGQKGQRLKPKGQKIHRAVKKLFQENHVPPWIRAHVPFIYYKDELVSLGFEWSNAKGFEGIKLEVSQIEI